MSELYRRMANMQSNYYALRQALTYRLLLLTYNSNPNYPPSLHPVIAQYIEQTIPSPAPMFPGIQALVQPIQNGENHNRLNGPNNHVNHPIVNGNGNGVDSNDSHSNGR